MPIVREGRRKLAGRDPLDAGMDVVERTTLAMVAIVQAVRVQVDPATIGMQARVIAQHSDLLMEDIEAFLRSMREAYQFIGCRHRSGCRGIRRYSDLRNASTPMIPASASIAVLVRFQLVEDVVQAACSEEHRHRQRLAMSEETDLFPRPRILEEGCRSTAMARISAATSAPASTASVKPDPAA